MSAATIKTEKADGLKAWLEAKPYWERYVWHLHLNKESLATADIAQCYQYLLEDSGVIKKAVGRIPIVFPALTLEVISVAHTKSTLVKLENLKEVNAIDERCVIEFGKNLTVIYGDNGSGKSGIGRLLSNACSSRRPRTLLGNARKAAYSSKRPTADFHLTDASGPVIVSYTLGDTQPILKAFSVFDRECALAHLDSENKVAFVPSKILVFDDVFKSISSIETLLQEAGHDKEVDDPTEGVFDGYSAVTEFVDSLSHTTTDKEIDAALKFTAADMITLSEKRKAHTTRMKQDVSAQKTLLREECADLETFARALADKRGILSKARQNQINGILREIKEKSDIVDKLSVKSFEFSAFKNIGSAEWKALILAAQKLHEKEVASMGGTAPAHCILCRQPLTAKERSLFANYWKFLRSTAEGELATARKTLRSYVETLERANMNWPVFTMTEVAVKILQRDASPSLKALKGAFDTLRAQLQDWIGKAKKEKDATYSDPKIDLDPIAKLVADKRKAEGKLVDPTPQINKLAREIFYFEQKQQASRLIPKIKKYVTWLRWQNAVSPINLPAVRGATTRKRTDIMGEIVMSRYVDIFNRETERLDCNFGLKVESHGEHAKTIKELKLEFARGHNPSDILSEGEQTVSALADFLTEAQLDENNAGIIFDDPVTSLDHARRSTIARRLVDEAKDRQVVVLTHDIVFLLELKSNADSASVSYDVVTMRRNGDRVGVIKKELPWFALNVKSRVGYLRNDLARLKKLEGGDQDDYRKEVKGWYELLREAWERAVEERLFKGVVQRFAKGVQTQRLAKVDVSAALIKEVDTGMTESSKWVHDMGTGMNPAIPKNAELNAQLNILDGFITKCAA